MAVLPVQQPSAGRAERPALATILLAIAVTLSGCGGGGNGGGGGTTTTTTTTLPTGCTSEQNENRCQHCAPGKPSTCLKCEKGYGMNTNTGLCEAVCLLPNYTKPSTPYPGMQNGIAWPDECFPETESNFFAIGDWGGLTPGHPADNTNGKRGDLNYIDKNAQQLVADVMNARAQKSKPRFVLNVGDNFYWGGVDTHKCGDASANHGLACSEPTFQSKFENMYTGEGMDGVPWYSVLGNHDYGGFGCGVGWDLQVFRTYCPNSRWRMPGLWWSQKVQFKNFAVDMYFLDSNANDAFAPDQDPNHNICHQDKCGACNVPNASWTDAASCGKALNSFWTQGVDWLEAKLKQSTADWRIAVTHFPPTWRHADWKRIAKKYPLDLIVVGHTHLQHLYTLGSADPNALGKDFPTTYVITGGGGGITAEGGPDMSGDDDQYGFVEFTVSRSSLNINMISHGGVSHQKWISRRTTKLSPRGSASNTAALAANAAVTTTREEIVV